MTKKNIVAIIMLLALSTLCARLGVWQLSRANERLSISQEITTGRQQTPLNLNTKPALTHNWQPANATGHWLPRFTVLLENRNHQGLPGYWLSTPLLLDTNSNEAVLVLRGWFARDSTTPELPALATTQTVHVQGELRSHVPRMYEIMNLWGPKATSLPTVLPTGNGQIPSVQNLELNDLQQATALTLRPYVLLLNESTPRENPSLIQDWPQPNLDAHQNRGYAIQWFSFSAIAGGAAFVLLWRTRRSKPTSRGTDA